MIPRILPLLSLATTCVALNLSLTSPNLRLPSQNNTTTPPPLTTINTTTLSAWPPVPITRHLAFDISVEILKRKPPPSSSDPTSEMAVLAGISVLREKARARSSRYPLKEFHEASWPVKFDFHATGDPFRGSDVAMVLNVLWDMTNRWGKADVYGGLLKGRTGLHTAYFQLGIGKVTTVS